jgi:hypothetical protein
MTPQQVSLAKRSNVSMATDGARSPALVRRRGRSGGIRLHAAHGNLKACIPTRERTTHSLSWPAITGLNAFN